MNRMLLGMVAAGTLAGCSSMSGLDASAQFACKAPDGVLCESMSGIYANAAANNLPGQRVHRPSAPGPDTHPATGADTSASTVLSRPIASGTPLRSAPRVLRVWIAPWEDSDGDLHDQSYVYLTLDTGRWLIEHNRRRIQDAYQPVRPPSAAPTSEGLAAQGKREGRVVTPGIPQAPSDQMPAADTAGPTD